ncbi:MAG: winged helix DNA-binding domain-containing protein [Anaerolineales bacterium]
MRKVIRLTWNQVLSRRLARHGLQSPLAASPADATAAMCGAHAQVLTAAEWSVGLRLAHSSRAEVQRALWEEHSLIKTIGPRGTVHLLPAKDLSWWTGALSALPNEGDQFADGMRLTAPQRDEVVEVIAEALLEAELTVDELHAAVLARTGSWAADLVIPAFQTYWPRWRQAIGSAAYRGVLCFGPNRGRNVTYTNPRRWLPKLKPARAGLRLLLQQYLYAYGPATPQHFARWLAAPPRWAEELFQISKDDLQPVMMDDVLAWVSAGDARFLDEKPRGVRLLPYFDAYAVGSHPRQWLFPGRAAERAMARGQAGNFPVLLIDGVVAGVWHQKHSGRNLHLSVESLGKLTAAQKRELEGQVARLGEFMDAQTKLTVGKVSIDAHA